MKATVHHGKMGDISCIPPLRWEAAPYNSFGNKFVVYRLIDEGKKDCGNRLDMFLKIEKMMKCTELDEKIEATWKKLKYSNHDWNSDDIFHSNAISSAIRELDYLKDNDIYKLRNKPNKKGVHKHVSAVIMGRIDASYFNKNVCYQSEIEPLAKLDIYKIKEIEKFLIEEKGVCPLAIDFGMRL